MPDELREEIRALEPYMRDALLSRAELVLRQLDATPASTDAGLALRHDAQLLLTATGYYCLHSHDFAGAERYYGAAFECATAPGARALTCAHSPSIALQAAYAAALRSTVPPAATATFSSSGGHHAAKQPRHNSHKPELSRSEAKERAQRWCDRAREAYALAFPAELLGQVRFYQRLLGAITGTTGMALKL